MNLVRMEELENSLRDRGLLDDPDLNKLLESYKKRTRTKYGLVWEDHPEQVHEELKTGITKVTEYVDRRIVTDVIKPQNLLIEGDNLHGLMLLKDQGVKVDVIYIDPPYNTGKEFVYNDRLVDNEDGYRHSKWLSFMSKRLDLAYDLLADDGVIFISIDDNEQANLKLLMDDIFGSNNFRSNIVWQSTIGSNTGDDIINITEYVLVYSKTKNYDLKRLPFVNDGRMRLKDAHFERRGYYALDKLDSKRQSNHYSESMNYPILIDGEPLYPGGKSVRQNHWNWMWSKDKVEWGLQNDFIHINRNADGSTIVYNKRYELVDNQDRPFERGSVFKNLILAKEFQTSDGTRELSNVFGKSYTFDYPKPSGLIRKLLSITNKDSIVLDFFAGSGTTGQAVMDLNCEDGGHRQFILMTNNEVSYEATFSLAIEELNIQKLLLDADISLVPHKGSGSVLKNKQRKKDIELFFESGVGKEFFNSDIVQNEGICRKVTYERIRRVIEGDYAKGKVDPLPNNVSYYKLEVEQDFDFEDEYLYTRDQTLLGLIAKEKTLPTMINETTHVFDRGNNQALVYDSSLFVAQKTVDDILDQYKGYTFEIISENNNSDVKLKQLERGMD